MKGQGTSRKLLDVPLACLFRYKDAYLEVRRVTATI